ncbi:hypothetical protein TNCV_3366401 [Trichonephila clavipes]|nr:hypothetical protein TNCV_3366401 [Trichonephila clavipes]
MALEIDETSFHEKRAGVEWLKSDGYKEISVRGLELRQAAICIKSVEHSAKLIIRAELVAFTSNCLTLLMED